MSDSRPKKLIIKLKEENKYYLLYNDGSIEDESNGITLDRKNDNELIAKIMDRFKHGFSDDI